MNDKEKIENNSYNATTHKKKKKREGWWEFSDKEKFEAIKALFVDLSAAKLDCDQDAEAVDRMYELIKECRKILELDPDQYPQSIVHLWIGPDLSDEDLWGRDEE